VALDNEVYDSFEGAKSAELLCPVPLKVDL